MNTIMDQFAKTFGIPEWSSARMKLERYCGHDIRQLKDYSFEVTQNTYLDEKVHEILLTEERRKQTTSLLTEEEISELRTATGKAHWVTTATQPQGAFCIKRIGFRNSSQRILYPKRLADNTREGCSMESIAMEIESHATGMSLHVCRRDPVSK